MFVVYKDLNSSWSKGVEYIEDSGYDYGEVIESSYGKKNWKGVKKNLNKPTIQVRPDNKGFLTTIKKKNIIGRAKTKEELMKKFSAYMI